MDNSPQQQTPYSTKGSDLILDDAKFATQPNEIEDPVSRERQKFTHQVCEEKGTGQQRQRGSCTGGIQCSVQERLQDVPEEETVEKNMHFGDRATVSWLEVSKRMVADLSKVGNPEAVEKTRKSYVNDIVGGGDEVMVDRLVGAGLCDKGL